MRTFVVTVVVDIPDDATCEPQTLEDAFNSQYVADALGACENPIPVNTTIYVSGVREVDEFARDEFEPDDNYPHHDDLEDYDQDLDHDSRYEE